MDAFSSLLNKYGLSFTKAPIVVMTIDKIFYLLLWNCFSPNSIAGPPQRMLSSLLHSFVDSSRGGVPFHATPLPVLGLSEGDKQCIRNRSSIMARHIFADKSEDFINAQVWNFTCFFLILLLHEFQIFFGDFLYPSFEFAFHGLSQVPMTLWCFSNLVVLQAWFRYISINFLGEVWRAIPLYLIWCI